MSIVDWFANKEKEKTRGEDKLNIPGDLWVKCFSCGEILFLKDLVANLKVCTKCKYHFRITPDERVSFLFDKDSFVETNASIKSVDFLNFTDTQNYKERIDKAMQKAKRNEAVIIGHAAINDHPVNVGVMDFAFMGGSMGSVVGEKITRLIEQALDNKFPVIIFSSSGGARMQEGLTSLMQMAKTSGALLKLAEQNIPFFSVLCDPTTGGTTASFAMLGDVNIAEPGALICFAGPRVIEQTIRQKLPKGFQQAEFLLQHGMVDLVIDRNEMKQSLYNLILMLNPHQDLKTKVKK
jgi:acetyl-CoA carboxylase carboxyl transferase subunit beta